MGKVYAHMLMGLKMTTTEIFYCLMFTKAEMDVRVL